MKKGIIRIVIASLLLTVFTIFGCSNSGNSSQSTKTKFDLKEMLNAENVLAKYDVDKDRAQKVESILDVLSEHMIESIDAIIEDNVHREKTRVEKKAYSVAPMFDYDKKNRMELQNQFRIGKISSYSIETIINEQIEAYNDEHLYGRLFTVSLQMDSIGSFVTDSFYSSLSRDKWKDKETKKEIETQVMKSYCNMFLSEKLIEQMIGESVK